MVGEIHTCNDAFLSPKTFVVNAGRITLYVVPRLEEIQPWIVFQQNWASNARDFLDETFPNRWIGRDRPTACPSLSPDITPLDLFFLGLYKIHCVCYTCSWYGHIEEKNQRCNVNNHRRDVGQEVSRNRILVRYSQSH